MVRDTNQDAGQTPGGSATGDAVDGVRSLVRGPTCSPRSTSAPGPGGAARARPPRPAHAPPFPLLESAPGLVHAAWLPDGARAALLARLTGSGAAEIGRGLAEVRRQGYCARAWTAVAGRVMLIAVPVVTGDRSAASLGLECLECLEDAVGAAGPTERCLPLLREGAVEIAAALEGMDERRG